MDQDTTDSAPGSSNNLDVEDFESFIKNAYQVLINATIASNGLPKKTNYVYCQSFPKFREFTNEQGSKILNMIQKLYSYKQCPIDIRKLNLKQQMQILGEYNAKILEQVEKNINKLSGNNSINVDPIIVEAESITKPLTPNDSPLEVPRSSTIMRALLARNVVRPQNSFRDRIDNSIDTPWEPRIKDKPNSIKPLAIFLEETSDEFGQGYTHPYEVELDHFKPSADLLTEIEPILPKSLEDVPLKLVSTVEQLKEMYEDLLKYKEIAIDLEHHSYRTFQGITCLMQISTGDIDYIVDTLSLRNDLHLLNEIFTKPSVVKVLHGAIQDIQWLQRDLSLYIVNMFDTHIAAKHLNYPHLSLAALLLKFCKRKVDKTFQLADWRIRPLPQELIHYAREDTHYLLYIYHMLRNELLQKGMGTTLLESVISQSTELCKQRYVKPVYTNDTYLKAYHASRKTFNNQQLWALQQLYHWREITARGEDESLSYVLPTHMMLQIAETLPREEQGILACCNPVPPLVRQNLLSLHRMIVKARLKPLEKPILKPEPIIRHQTYGSSLNWDSPLYCPHDLSKSEDFVEGLPTLLGTKQTKNSNSAETFIKSKADISVFDQIPTQTENDNIERQVHLQKVTFLCPYDRYKLIKEYAQDKTKREEEAKKEEEKKQQKLVENDNTERMARLYERVNKLVEEVFGNEISTEKLSLDESTLEIQAQTTSSPAPKLEDQPQPDKSLNEMKRKQKRHRQEDPENVPCKKQKYSENSITDNSHESDLLLFSKVTKDDDRGSSNAAVNSERPKKYRRNRRKKHKNNVGQTNNQIEINKNGESSQKDTSQVNISKEFKSFDYKNVDFQRFKGGSSTSSKHNEPHSKFKQKGKNKKFHGKKKNNKHLFKGSLKQALSSKRK